MADEEKEQEGEAQAASEKKGKKGIVRALIGLILFVGVVFLTAVVAYYVATSGFVQNLVTAGSQNRAGTEVSTEPLMTFEMGNFTVILEDEAGRTHNVKMNIYLAYDENAVASAIAARKIELTSKINLLLLSQDVASLRSAAGRTDLINQILKLVNDSLPYGLRIRDVYFTEYIVQ